MTREEAITVLNMVEAHGPLVIEAKKMAIEALKQPERKKGEWIECNNFVFDKFLFDTNTFFRCSLCTHDVKRKTKYCSACGAKMDLEEERSNKQKNGQCF